MGGKQDGKAAGYLDRALGCLGLERDALALAVYLVGEADRGGVQVG
jgi:hypothetical protein